MPVHELCHKLQQTNTFFYIDPPTVKGKGFCHCVYKTCANLWKKNKENNDASQLLVVSLDKLTRTRMRSMLKLTNLLASQNRMKDNT